MAPLSFHLSDSLLLEVDASAGQLGIPRAVYVRKVRIPQQVGHLFRLIPATP